MFLDGWFFVLSVTNKQDSYEVDTHVGDTLDLPRLDKTFLPLLFEFADTYSI